RAPTWRRRPPTTPRPIAPAGRPTDGRERDVPQSRTAVTGPHARPGPITTPAGSTTGPADRHVGQQAGRRVAAPLTAGRRVSRPDRRLPTTGALGAGASGSRAATRTRRPASRRAAVPGVRRSGGGGRAGGPAAAP